MRLVHLLVTMLLVAATGCGGSRTLEGRDAGCASCHGSPPGGSHPQPAGTSWAAANCSPCHASSVGPNGELLATHADGNTNVSPPPGHTAAFLDANGTIDPANARLHGALANQRIDLCAACHGADFGDASFGQSCNGCHTTLGFADWKTNCTFCHGTRTASWSPTELPLAAPPQDVSGSGDTTLPTVGAHQAHAANAQIACTVCHPSPLPVDVLAAGHIDGAQATVQFSGLAVTGGLVPEWNLGNAATCATVYCHGGGFAPGAGGGTHTTPTWTDVGSGQGDCGGCHALPPPAAAHPQTVAGLFASLSLPDCSLCHATTVDTGGALLSGHLDGTTAAAPDCSTCHTPPPQFHTRVSAQAPSPYACSVCHESFVPATHRDGATPLPNVTCATCHGDVAALPAPTAASPRAAAPPADKFGNAVSVVVGAHAAHLDGGTYSNVIACGACHPGVASYTNRHADGSTQVSFASGPGKSGTFAAGVAGVAGSCSSTWCHGNFPGGLNATPAWDWALSCRSCHPLAPVTGSHAFHVDPVAAGGLGRDCSICHTGFAATRNAAGVVTSVVIDAATAKPSHVNGTKDVAPISGTWSPTPPASCSSVACHVDFPASRAW